jgi:parvulin-like peptidyl-prolyl isomerase
MIKKTILRMAGLALALIFSAGAVSCSVSKDPVVMKVGDKEYRLSDYEKEYTSYQNYYTRYGMYDVSSEDKLKQFQDMVYDIMLGREVLLYNAKLQGIELTEDEVKDAESKADEEMKNLEKNFIDRVDAKITDPKERETTGKANMAYTLALQDTSYDKLRAETVDSYKATAIRDKLRKQIVDNTSVTDDEALAFYQKTLEEDRTEVTDDPGVYKTYEDYYEVSGGVPPLVVPEGYIRVKHILVQDNTLIKIVESELAAGKDFDELLVKYGQDPGMKAEPAKSKGYLLSEYPAVSDYYQEFKDAALALKEVGDVSPAVQTKAGTHYIKLIEKVPARDIPYEEVKDAILQAALNQKMDEKFNSALKTWMAEDYITEYRDLIRNVGKTEQPSPAVTAPAATQAPAATAAPQG